MASRTLAAPALVAALALTAGPRIAAAQTAQEVAARRGLLEHAEAAARAGDHAGALEFAERAGRISMTPSLRGFIATEQGAVGRLAEALGNAELCVQTAEHDPTLRIRDSIIANCRALIAQISPRVARVVLRPPTPAPPGLQITIGGQVVSDAFWGVPFVVTPGALVIEVTAPGHAPSRRDLSVAVGATQDVPVTPGAATAVVAATPGTSVAPGGPAVVVGPPVPAAVDGGPGPWPFVVVGAGALSLVGAAVAGFAIRGPALSSLEAACPNRMACTDTPTNRGNFDTAVTASLVTNVTVIAGGVLVAGGLVWWLVARPSGRGARPRAQVGIAPLADGPVLTVGGAL